MVGLDLFYRRSWYPVGPYPLSVAMLSLPFLEPAASEGLHSGFDHGQASADHLLARDGLHDRFQ